MNWTEMITNAQTQEQQIVTEINRLERMLWALRGQIDLLQQLKVQDATMDTVTDYRTNDQPNHYRNMASN